MRALAKCVAWLVGCALLANLWFGVGIYVQGVPVAVIVTLDALITACLVGLLVWLTMRRLD